MKLHPLLARQLARLDITGSRSAVARAMGQAPRAGEPTYQEAEQDRYLLERSQDLASAEMAELYAALEAEKAQLETRVHERTTDSPRAKHTLPKRSALPRSAAGATSRRRARSNWSEECYRLLGWIRRSARRRSPG